MVKTKTVYKFKLREDMPRGFIKNEQYPELPAINEYLKTYNGKKFESLATFEEGVLQGFLDYLSTKQVPVSSDPELRTGLKLEKLPQKFEKEGWDYMVFTPATNGPGCCVFGGLEEITLD